MRLTSKGRYAVRAMLDLTAHSNGNPVRLQEISTRQNISLHYLEQLFRKLRNKGAVKSVRGPGGGYVLSRPMDEITIKYILECVGENINPAKDIVGSEAATCNTIQFHLSKNYFSNLAIIMEEYLKTTSLGDLIRKTSEVVAETNIGQEVVQETTINLGPETETINLEEDYISSIRSKIGEVNQ